ncbi:hypothetical protein AVEN_134175-1 [Araneus ventricosus]|uniref:Uncharacterized protein n=1 Tax=Araneus ventricosus TaxID=182803 RepID=A0A4Y2W0F7_ARAVE|nr:hypothetical protein AVEN_134175-1 [Araneus ventricosus]
MGNEQCGSFWSDVYGKRTKVIILMTCGNELKGGPSLESDVGNEQRDHLENVSKECWSGLIVRNKEEYSFWSWGRKKNG